MDTGRPGSTRPGCHRADDPHRGRTGHDCRGEPGTIFRSGSRPSRRGDAPTGCSAAIAAGPGHAPWRGQSLAASACPAERRPDRGASRGTFGSGLAATGDERGRQAWHSSVAAGFQARIESRRHRLERASRPVPAAVGRADGCRRSAAADRVCERCQPVARAV